MVGNKVDEDESFASSRQRSLVKCGRATAEEALVTKEKEAATSMVQWAALQKAYNKLAINRAYGLALVSRMIMHC